jgi:predicted acyl esterase
VIVTTFPRTVRVIEHTLIPLKDGTTLAACIWLPDDAEQNPVLRSWSISPTASATGHTSGTR